MLAAGRYHKRHLSRDAACGRNRFHHGKWRLRQAPATRPLDWLQTAHRTERLPKLIARNQPFGAASQPGGSQSALSLWLSRTRKRRTRLPPFPAALRVHAPRHSRSARHHPNQVHTADSYPRALTLKQTIGPVMELKSTPTGRDCLAAVTAQACAWYWTMPTPGFYSGPTPRLQRFAVLFASGCVLLHDH